MSVYSVLLARNVESGASATNVFTCPAGSVAIVRDIEVVASITAAGYFQVASGTSTHNYFWNTALASGTSWAQWTGRLVLNAGDSLFVTSDALGNHWYTISGYLLDAS